MQATKCNIDDLNQQLFAQLQMLNTDLSPDELKAEVTKAKAMTDIAGTILEGKRIQLEAAELIATGKVYSENAQGIVEQKQLN
jgi:hypothetical protein